MATKICKCCGRELPYEEFKDSRWGYKVSVCKECDTQHRRENKAKKSENMKSEIDAIREECRRLRISEFTPRELMTELKRKGYEGKITYTRTEVIDLSTDF